MGLPKKIRPPLPPIWEASDAVWAIVEPIPVERHPPKPCGRKRIDQRATFDAIFFRLRTGCQWNHLPQEYPDDASVHCPFQRCHAPESKAQHIRFLNQPNRYGKSQPWP